MPTTVIIRSYPYMTDDEVRAIFEEYYGQPYLTITEIAKKYGVARSTISNIINRKRYADVPIKMTVPT
jgi:plasmid maintenance system antidote protein VapI